MGDAVLLLALWATGWLLLRAERQRLERERLHRLLAAAADWPEVIGRGFRAMVDAVGRIGDVYASAMAAVPSLMRAAAEAMALEQAAVRSRALIGTTCWCGWAEAAGGAHNHVARMAAGAPPDLVLVPDEVWHPQLGVAVVPLLDDRVRHRLGPRLEDLAVTIAPARLLGSWVERDPSLPPRQHLPFVRRTQESAA